MIIDSHCHLDYPGLYENLDSVIDRARKKNVLKLLTISTKLESIEKISLICENYKSVKGTAGIHPHESEKYKNVNSDYLVNVVKKNQNIIGIGETGLDFYYNHSDKNSQIALFREHIKAALKLDIPLIVHTRNAEEETYEILKNDIKNTKAKILIHCFTGSYEFAKKLLDINCYISFSGIITFNNSKELAHTASKIPLEKILIETDSPFLAPHPFRGKTNEPSYIEYTAMKLAELKKSNLKNINSITSNNFNKLFSI